jgi:hypothetical protein
MLNDAESEGVQPPAREADRGRYSALLVRLRSCTAFGVVAITAILYGVILYGRLAFHHWDPTFFIRAGGYFYDQSRSPQPLTIRHYTGYDGQFYYRFALDPLSNERTAYGITIDGPAYRGQRILYPVLAYLLAFGRMTWVPWSMIIVNYLAICGLALSAGRLAELLGAPALYGLALPLLPAALLGLARDLTDPTAIALMVFALFLIQSRRTSSGACILALAVLARETMVVLAAALFIQSGWRAIRKQSRWGGSIVLLIPIATYVLVQLWMFLRWKDNGVVGGRGNLDYFPLLSLVSLIAHAARIWDASSVSSFLYHLFLLAELGFLGGMILLAALAFSRTAIASELKFAWLTYLVLAAFFSNAIWVEDWAFMRACEEPLVLGLLIVMGAHERRWLQIAAASTCAIWIPLALRVVLIP